MSKKTLKITQGALMTAIFGVLVFLNRQTAGFAEQILVYVYPLPIAVYGARYGFKDGAPAAAAMALLAFFLGSLNYAFYAATSLLTGYVCGGCIHRGFPAGKTLLIMMIIGVLVNLADFTVMAEVTGISFMEQVTELEDFGKTLQNGLNGLQESAEELSPQAGTLADSIAGRFGAAFNVVFSVEFLKKFLIVVSVITGILQAFLIYMLSTIVMRFMKIRVPGLKFKGKNRKQPGPDDIERQRQSTVS